MFHFNYMMQSTLLESYRMFRLKLLKLPQLPSHLSLKILKLLVPATVNSVLTTGTVAWLFAKCRHASKLLFYMAAMHVGGVDREVPVTRISYRTPSLTTLEWKVGSTCCIKCILYLYVRSISIYCNTL